VTSCAYCGQRATVHIPSNPEHVCREHAVEFWAGLLAYVKDRTDHRETPDTPCTCRTCNQLSAVSSRLSVIAGDVTAPPAAEPVPAPSSRRFSGGAPGLTAAAATSGEYAAPRFAQAADVPARPEALPLPSPSVTVRRTSVP
jgi:hypothetical protein